MIGFASGSLIGSPNQREAGHPTPRRAADYDIEDALDYHAKEAGPSVADSFLRSIKAAFNTIGDQPGIGSSSWAAPLRISAVRTRSVGNFPYRVFYVEHDDYVEVLRILHAQSDITARFIEP